MFDSNKLPLMMGSVSRMRNGYTKIGGDQTTQSKKLVKATFLRNSRSMCQWQRRDMEAVYRRWELTILKISARKKAFKLYTRFHTIPRWIPYLSDWTERCRRWRERCYRNQMVCWNEVVMAANCLKNRSTTSAVGKQFIDKTPAELWYGSMPDVSNVRVFGSICYKIPSER